MSSQSTQQTHYNKLKKQHSRKTVVSGGKQQRNAHIRSVCGNADEKRFQKTSVKTHCDKFCYVSRKQYPYKNTEKHVSEQKKYNILRVNISMTPQHIVYIWIDDKSAH
jgi:hypothetical protein